MNPVFSTLIEPMLERRLQICRNSPEKDSIEISLGLMLFAHRIAAWFAATPALQQIMLTAVMQPVAHASSVRIQHHFKLTCVCEEGRPLGFPQTSDEVDQFVLNNLPWEKLGEACVRIQREDLLETLALLQTAEPDAVDYETSLYKLAVKMGAGLSRCEVIHDVGLTSIGANL